MPLTHSDAPPTCSRVRTVEETNGEPPGSLMGAPAPPLIKSSCWLIHNVFEAVFETSVDAIALLPDSIVPRDKGHGQRYCVMNSGVVCPNVSARSSYLLVQKLLFSFLALGLVSVCCCLGWQLLQFHSLLRRERSVRHFRPRSGLGDWVHVMDCPTDSPRDRIVCLFFFVCVCAYVHAVLLSTRFAVNCSNCCRTITSSTTDAVCLSCYLERFCHTDRPFGNPKVWMPKVQNT